MYSLGTQRQDMAQTESLEHLVQGSVAGDTEAFRVLAVRLDAKIFGYVRSRASSRDEALDLTADILVDVWRALRSFRYESDPAFYRFVYTIAKRHLYRSWRKEKLLSLEDVASEPSVTPAYENASVSVAVEKLPRSDRDIVVLRHWSGFSFKEIGDQLGMNETAIRVRHHRALTKLRASLASYA